MYVRSRDNSIPFFRVAIQAETFCHDSRLLTMHVHIPVYVPHRYVCMPTNFFKKCWSSFQLNTGLANNCFAVFKPYIRRSTTVHSHMWIQRMWIHRCALPVRGIRVDEADFFVHARLCLSRSTALVTLWPVHSFVLLRPLRGSSSLSL